MNRTAPIWIALLALSPLSPLHGQAMVEFGNLLGAGAGGGAPIGDVGKALQNLINGSMTNMPAPQTPVTNFTNPASPNFKMPNFSMTPNLNGIGASPFGTRARRPAASGMDNAMMQAWMNAFGMGQQQFAPEVTQVSPDKMATPRPDTRTYEDPKLIQPGTGYDELIDRFGKPLMELTTGPGMKSLMYANLDGTTRTVELQDDKVAGPATVAPTPKARPAEPKNYVPMTIR